MYRYKNLYAILFCASVSSCVSDHNTAIDSYEKALGLDSRNSRNFHSLLYFPSGTALHFPGYIVAIEKSPQYLVGGPKVNPDASLIRSTSYFKLEKSSLYDTQHLIRRFQRYDTKTMFISHIIKNGFTVIPGNVDTPYITNNHCFVYNAYIAKSLSDSTDTDLTKINDWHACNHAAQSSNPASPISSFYINGNDALASLKKNLEEDTSSGAYTHILLIVMGWNTSQNEAIRNFNDITGNIMAASREPGSNLQSTVTKRANAIIAEKPNQGTFRPLVIGVTWPSYWSTSAGNVLSYGNKANDADEIGLTWLNKIVNETLPQSMAKSKRLPIIAVGHSFGGRAMTRALFSNPALLENQQKLTSPVNLAIALQGAMSINRFSPTLSDEGAPYRDYTQLSNTKIVLTASKYDRATGPVFWYEPAGAINSYQKACAGASYPAIFHCMAASDTSAMPDGKFSLCNRGDNPDNCADPFNTSSLVVKVDYIDTSNGITQFNSPGTGGVAHSDIYRLPMGRLLWRLIQQYTIK